MRMKEAAEVIKEAERMTGAVRRERMAEARRGPRRSQAGPMARREKTEPTKAATPEALMSASVRWRSARMTGRSGGMEKVEKKQAKSESQAKWKARMCGCATEKGRKTAALPSESTGRVKRGSSGDLVFS